MESEQMTVSERTPTTRGEYYFSLGWIRYYRYRTEQSRESAKTTAAPLLRVAASTVVRSRVENSIESGYGSRDRSWYQYFKGARSSIDRIFCIINRHSTPGTSTLTVHTAHVYTPHGYMYICTTTATTITATLYLAFFLSLGRAYQAEWRISGIESAPRLQVK